MPTSKQPQTEQQTATPPPRLVARLAFRLPEQIAQSWRRQAESSGASLSDWVRSKVDTEQTTGIAAPAKMPKRRNYTPVDPELLRQIAMIGNNLNQIARSVNSNELSMTGIQIIASLSSIRQELTTLIDREEPQNAD